MNRRTLVLIGAGTVPYKFDPSHRYRTVRYRTVPSSNKNILHRITRLNLLRYRYDRVIRKRVNKSGHRDIKFIFKDLVEMHRTIPVRYGVYASYCFQLAKNIAELILWLSAPYLNSALYFQFFSMAVFSKWMMT